jgi:hypothetical protein
MRLASSRSLRCPIRVRSTFEPLLLRTQLSSPELPDQHGSQHDLIVDRMYLEADHPATVLLDEGFGATG